jgi:hypothetical protein
MTPAKFGQNYHPISPAQAAEGPAFHLNQLRSGADDPGEECNNARAARRL